MKVFYCVHQQPETGLLGNTGPGYTPKPYFFKIHFNILPFKPTSSKRFLPFTVSNQNVSCISHLNSHVTFYPLDLVTIKYSGQEDQLWKYTLRNFLTLLLLHIF
jgi:hypothetical protein